MLYRFKTKQAADVVMLEATGNRVLSIIGKSPGAQGIVLNEDIPAALAALRLAIEVEELQLAVQQTEHDSSEDSAPERGDSIRFKQRALPFVTLLNSAHTAGDAVVWGV